jgi:hypothetical protein
MCRHWCADVAQSEESYFHYLILAGVRESAVGLIAGTRSSQTRSPVLTAG